MCFSQKITDLTHNVLIEPGLVGGVGEGTILGMHHRQDGLMVADNGSEIGIGAKGGNVVDHDSTEFETTRCCRRAVGVDRERYHWCKGTYNAVNPRKLFLGCDGLASRRGGLAANVDQVRPLVDQGSAVGNRIRLVEIIAAVCERIGGDVQNAHHIRGPTVQ